MRHAGSLTNDDIVMLQELMDSMADSEITKLGIWQPGDYEMLRDLVATGIEELYE